MKISSLRCRRISAPLHTPFVTALRRTDTLDTVVVEIGTADGLVGRGEAPAVWRVTGESLDSAEACLTGPLAAALHGTDADDLHARLRDLQAAVVGNTGAKAAADVALHDLAAQRAGLPLHRYLGGGDARVTTDVTVSAGEAEVLEAAARARVTEGFCVLKLKVGADPGGDVRRVLAVRRAVGSDVRLRLDANQGWTPKQAVRVVRALEDADADVELVEQPVAAADVDGLAHVTRAVDTTIMADESVFGVRDVVDVIRRRAADMVNVKLAKCGGLHPARTMLEVARAHGVGTMVGSMMEGPIGVGAAAALVSAYPTSVVGDLDAAWWAAESPVVGGVTYGAGELVLPEAPGLGLEGVR